MFMQPSIYVEIKIVYLFYIVYLTIFIIGIIIRYT